jgi:hypothetical protein
MKLKTVLNIEFQVPKEWENGIKGMKPLKRMEFYKTTTDDMVEAIKDNIFAVSKMKVTGKTTFEDSGISCNHICPIRSHTCCWDCFIGSECKQACKLNPNECEKRDK